MNEITDSIDVNENQLSNLNFTTIQTKVFQCVNVVSVPLGSTNSNIFRYVNIFCIEIIYIFIRNKISKSKNRSTNNINLFHGNRINSC